MLAGALVAGAATALVATPAATQAAAGESATVEQMLKTGPSRNRIDVVILGDGYRAREMDKFEEDAEEFLDYMLMQQPFKTYRRYFNALRIETPSRQSGASRPDEPVDNVYGSRFGCFDIRRLLCADDDRVEEVVLDNLKRNQIDMVLVLVNDEEYGGSGGDYAVASTHELSREVAVHEFGHSFGHLDDEYIDDNCGRYDDPWGFNVTQKRKKPQIPWKVWIPKKQTLPTPDDGDHGTGLYEGAYHCAEGWFRPTYDSIMRTNGAPAGPVNSEQFVRRFYETIRPLDSVKPKSDKVRLARGTSKRFKSDLADKRLKTISTVWRLDGKRISKRQASQVRFGDISGRRSTLTLSVRDGTPLVRNDPKGVLIETRNWRVIKRK
ncbi:M64 family metallopeptidase [Microbaculum marinum]|uniref:M64 family metallopeptidase n=1 Tax=Microbaculum marinum TaxID=1764581 RepID=A0AAW9RWF7_9HYPH